MEVRNRGVMMGLVVVMTANGYKGGNELGLRNELSDIGLRVVGGRSKNRNLERREAGMAEKSRGSQKGGALETTYDSSVGGEPRSVG